VKTLVSKIKLNNDKQSKIVLAKTAGRREKRMLVDNGKEIFKLLYFILLSIRVYHQNSSDSLRYYRKTGETN
jgi:hypothetical protein